MGGDFPLSRLRDASNRLGDPEQLRALAEAEGFVYLRGLLPTEPIERLRGRVLETCARIGWLEPGSDPREARPRRGVEIGAFDDPAWVQMQGEIQNTPEFHDLGGAPRLLELACQLGGGKAARTVANTCRVAAPAALHLTTPPHQDAHYVRRLDRFWTAWIPLGDCPLELGPLAILPGSHREGLCEHRGERVGGQSAEVALDRVWVSGDLIRGDVIFFDRLTLHRACPHRVPDRLRLSADYRYALGVDAAY